MLLQPENFLLADSSPDAQVICADFGLSTFFAEGEKFDDFVGSAYYVSAYFAMRSACAHDRNACF